MMQKGLDRMESKLKSFIGHDFNNTIDSEWVYERMQKTARAELRKMMLPYKITIHKFYKNHFEFSAILKEEESGNYIYIAIRDVRLMGDIWWNRVLYRTMANEKDARGGMNHFCRWDELAENIKDLLDKSR